MLAWSWKANLESPEDRAEIGIFAPRIPFLVGGEPPANSAGWHLPARRHAPEPQPFAWIIVLHRSSLLQLRWTRTGWVVSKEAQTQSKFLIISCCMRIFILRDFEPQIARRRLLLEHSRAGLRPFFKVLRPDPFSQHPNTAISLPRAVGECIPSPP